MHGRGAVSDTRGKNMISKMNLLQYLSEETYQLICDNLKLDGSSRKIKDNYRQFPGDLVCRVHPFNIVYNQFGQVWFLSIDIDFQQYKKGYRDFEGILYGEYLNIFGKAAMRNFPAYENIYCNYIEYRNDLEVENADQTIRNMALSGCPPEQLDERRWSDYKKPHGTIEFCVSKLGDTIIKTMARCHGTALQKRIKDKSLHHMGAGVCVSKMASEETEKEIMDWLYSKYKIFVPS